LPTFTLNGSQVQMGGVLGSKLVGVNRFSEEAGWAMRLADWITNYENQVLRFDMRAQGPSNIQAAGSAAVQADLVLAAIADQARFSATFIPGGNYWGPSGTLAAIIADGNQDGTPLQELIENAVEGMTS
ncbi:MAG: maltose ABC transporter substrate-binding protein, partial [Oscillospiraceae bacterium]|nr:maltose ABC transporter substrate-binding protein [Oscillospiraceae bacterium]